jgi:hypothetical protein
MLPREVEEKVFEFLNDYRSERCQKIRDGFKAISFLNEQTRFVQSLDGPIPEFIRRSLGDSFAAASTRLWHFTGPAEAKKYAFRALLMHDLHQRVPVIN